MLNLAPLMERPDDWDATIRHFHTKTLFHESVWLDHVQSILPNAKFTYYEILRDDTCVGYHCAIRIRKMLVPISASPLAGTGTNFLGPVVNIDLDQKQLVRALLDLARKERVAHVELTNPWLNTNVMQSLGFTVHQTVTHLIDLPDTVEDAWSMLKSTCRNRVRKALNNGLQAEITDDPNIADRYQEQFEEVYAKQGMILPYDVNRPRSLVRHLLPADRILPVWVKQNGEILATGLFPFDEGCIYFWGGASWLRHQHLCPNELLQWTVIEESVRRGIPRYNMCGGRSAFKSKFGGEDVPFIHYSRSALPGLSLARQIYRKLHFWKLKAFASPQVRRFAANRTEGPAATKADSAESDHDG